MTGNASSGTEWEFEQGETLVEQQGISQMPGTGGFENDPREYTVKRRLHDADGDKRLYYLEWEVETPGGPRVENQLYNADLVRLHYRSVDTATDRSGGETDV
ncbi:hypothetical protein [Natrinema sp. DC36]|uniref:hypothetical protein n=1 Tax=Natrinema sp. DC36 TaxID=2878680 RepID=UPI001CEFEE68|nr:hypothetical protein [Natrinema sp. DC36]